MELSTVTAVRTPNPIYTGLTTAINDNALFINDNMVLFCMQLYVQTVHAYGRKIFSRWNLQQQRQNGCRTAWVCCGAVSRKAQELNLIIQKALDQCMVDQAPPTASTAAILPKADTSIPNPRLGIPFDVSTLFCKTWEFCFLRYNTM